MLITSILLIILAIVVGYFSFPKKEPDPNCQVCKGTGFINHSQHYQIRDDFAPTTTTCKCWRVSVKKDKPPLRRAYDTDEDYEVELNQYYRNVSKSKHNTNSK